MFTISLEEDSEPILGLWFEETLETSDGPAANSSKENNEEANTERSATVVPDNKEPHGVSNFLFKIYLYSSITIIIIIILFQWCKPLSIYT